jgi:pyroglutamyl-peptidase
LRALDGKKIEGRAVVGAVLPCVFGASAEELQRWLRVVRPELVVRVGQAGGRSAITPERVAINVGDALIPDTAGMKPVDMPIMRGGPAAYWSTLPIKAIVAGLTSRGIPSAVSPTAGTYVCNHVFYCLMRTLACRKGIRGGFVHVPFLPHQAKRGQPSLPLDTMIAAITEVVAISLVTRRDIRRADGQPH